MAVNNSNDSRINTRSPYYLEAGRSAPEVVVVPDPDPPTNTAPTVTITATNKNPYLGDTVTLTAVATDSDGTIVSYLWGGTSSPLITASIDITNTDTVESQTYTVLVTDNDGDAATEQITINWQEEPVIINPDPSSIQCGDIVNEGSFIGGKDYTLDVGDKIGDVEITFLSATGNNNIPIKFTATWDSTTETTGYIGDPIYDDQLANLGVPSEDINTAAIDGTSNKTTGTQLTISKTSATPKTISLNAFAAIQNDSYSFRLDCPDVLAVPTKFVTLTSTCDGGTATFTYTDVNGDTQTVNIADGDSPVVVSAQPNTAIVTSCTGTVEEGGDSFDIGTPDQDVDDKLEINLITDASSFDSTSGKYISQMANGILKDKLIKFYNNDLAEYQKRVRVIDSAQLYREQNPSGSLGENEMEGFLKILTDIDKRNSDTTKIVNLYFLDEVNPVYMTYGQTIYSQVFQFGGTVIDRITSTYTSHLAAYKAHLDTLSYGDQLTTLFQVDNPGTPADWFTNVINGTGTTAPDQYGRSVIGFEGSRGLSDRASEISLVSNIRQGVRYIDEPNYYYNLVIQALKDYGYKI